MFYDNVKNLGESSLKDDFVLLENFLTKLPEVIDEVGNDLKDICIYEFDNSSFMSRSVYDTPSIINDHFKQLITHKRELKNEIVLDSKSLYKKLEEHGLTGDSLHVKLSFLDWLWNKAKDNIIAVRQALNNGLVQSLINSCQSILGSFLKALGFDPDIFDEDFNLLHVMVEMGNNKYDNN